MYPVIGIVVVADVDECYQTRRSVNRYDKFIKFLRHDSHFVIRVTWYLHMDRSTVAPVAERWTTERDRALVIRRITFYSVRSTEYIDDIISLSFLPEVA